MPARERPRARARACALLALLLAACATPPPIEARDVEAMLAQQAEAWNRGDLGAFMAGYWKSPALTFVGADGVQHGFDEVLARYERSYPDAAARGVLSFEVLAFRALSPDVAIAVGRYRLERARPATGVFTLVLERRPEGVRIVHDHSSASG